MENEKYFNKKTFEEEKEKVFSEERPVLKKDKDTEEAKQRKEIKSIERFVKMSGILEQQGADRKTEEDIASALKRMSSEEKASRIYEYLVTYSLKRRVDQKRETAKVVPSNPRFISEFKKLWDDEEARRIFLQKFGETRFDLLKHRLSPLVKEIGKIENSISGARGRFQELEQNRNLGRITDPTDIKSARSEQIFQKIRLKELLDEESKIINLEGYEHIEANTDAAAMLMYETLRRYQREIKEQNFAWLPSRLKIHEETRDIIEKHGQKPLLLGPPGTGKTSQINAIAQEMTGTDALRIGCHSGLAEEGLIVIRDMRAGEGAYNYSGTLTEAATGFTHSQNEIREYKEGRWAFLDEVSQLDLNRALGPLKESMDAKPGRKFSRLIPLFEVIKKEGAEELDTAEAKDLFFQLGGSEKEFEKLTDGFKKQKGRLLYRPVLPGFNFGATSNEPIKDERFDRHFRRIPTNYFEMNPENPELYEFLFVKLLREEGNMPLIHKSDLAPAYQKQDILESERQPFKDGSIPVARSELIKNPADVRHGFLYRFAYAIRAIQDSYIHGSEFNEKYLANTAIYEDTDQDGNIIIKDYVSDLTDKSQYPGGQMLKLKSGSSTITAEIVSKWMEGFSRGEEKNFIVWSQQVLKEHINRTSPEEGEKINAIADYFHIFDKIQERKVIPPLTQKEIGYLSPRVPRPVYVEKPIPSSDDTQTPDKTIKPKDLEEIFKIVKAVLEDGESVILRESGFVFKNKQDEEVNIKVGEKMMIDGKKLSLAGVIYDEESAQNGKSAGALIYEEGLFAVIEENEIERGILDFFVDLIGETGIDDFKDDFLDTWKNEGCEKKQGAFKF